MHGSFHPTLLRLQTPPPPFHSLDVFLFCHPHPANQHTGLWAGDGREVASCSEQHAGHGHDVVWMMRPDRLFLLALRRAGCPPDPIHA